MSEQAIILCGGEGTRVQHITKDIPKCVFPINARPFLFYLLTHLDTFHNIKDYILCVGNKGRSIRKGLFPYYPATDEFEYQCFDHMYFRGRILQFADETEPRGTLAGLVAAVPFITTDNVFVMNGDTLCKSDLGALSYVHKTNKADITVVNHEGVSTGLWVVCSSLLKVLSRLKPSSYNGVSRESLLEEKVSKIQYVEGPKFIDIGTPDGILQAQKELC